MYIRDFIFFYDYFTFQERKYQFHYFNEMPVYRGQFKGLILVKLIKNCLASSAMRKSESDDGLLAALFMSMLFASRLSTLNYS